MIFCFRRPKSVTPCSRLRPIVNLTLSWRRPLSYRNQSIDLLPKSVDRFLYDNGLRYERVKQLCKTFCICLFLGSCLSYWQWVFRITWDFFISLNWAISFSTYMCKTSFGQFSSDFCINLALSHFSLSSSMLLTRTLLS